MASRPSMPRRRFLGFCSSVLALVATRPRALAASGPIRRRNRVMLVNPYGEPVNTASLEPGTSYLFHYPYRSTPCFLIDLGEAMAGGETLETESGERYTWLGGSGPNRSIVAFSAICAHKMTHPLKAVNFINYRHEAHRFIARDETPHTHAKVVHCCSEDSVYDARRGCQVLGGPAPQPLAAIVLEHDPAADTLYAVGTYGGELFEPFFERFGERLILEYATTRYREPVKATTELVTVADYSRTQVLC